MFRNFSRSISNRSSNSSSHSRRGSEHKTDLAITAPKQIVRALYPYKSERPEELSFQKNDFFYVTDEPAGDWFVAFNPLQNTRGLVPISYFEVVQRQEASAVPVSQARRPQSRGQVNTSGVSSVHSRSQSNESQRSYGHSYNNSLGNNSLGASNTSPHKILQTSGALAHTRVGSAGSYSTRARSLALYGFVLYDFQAERNDELTVTAGESIVIVAQSTEEWFVAKPIGRLGGPGLIPISYVELREVGTDEILPDVNDAIQRAGLPQVDEWKRKLAEYKASSIPLGRFGDTTTSAAGAAPNGHSHKGSYGGPIASAAPAAAGAGAGAAAGYRSASGGSVSHGKAVHGSSGAGATAVTTAGPHAPTATPGVFSPTVPYVLSAKVDRFAINGGRYWYLVKVQMSNFKHRNLCRYYQDFYDFQIKLLEQFPEEAGRTGRQRTLPFMPGPLTLLSHTMTSQRRANLDEYVHELIRMPPYISQSPVVLDLFAVHPGDIERDAPTDEVPEPVDEEANEHYSGDVAEGTDSNSESSNTALNNNNNSNSNSKGIHQPPADISHSSNHSRNTNHPNTNPPTAQAPLAQSSLGTSTQTSASGSSTQQQQQHQQDLARKQNELQLEQMQRLELTNNQQQHNDQQRKLSDNSSRANYGQFSEGSVSTASVDDMYAQRSGSADTTATRGQYGDRNASLQKPGSSAAYKIKVYAHHEVFAIRMPVESSFSEIFEKISSRLTITNPQLYTSPEYEGEPVTTAAQFHNALNGGTKLALYLAP